ncbi:MAG: hypothetical protein ABJA85_04045 [Bacteroidota bacterium]
MKKFTLFFIAVLTFSLAVSAQAYESTIQFDKKKQPAIAIDYSYSPEAVENAIIKKMERLGYKAKEEKGLFNKDKGFLVFKNAYINDISADKMDYIIKVERKSRKENEEAVLYMIMNRDDENAMGRMTSYDIGRAKSFLNYMLPDIEVANLELQIIEKEEMVAKAEKKLKGLQEDKTDLDRKLADNLKAQDDTVRDIELQKQALEALREKRKTN